MENHDQITSDMQKAVSRLKFAKFAAALQGEDVDVGCIAGILQDEGDINYAIPFVKAMKTDKFERAKYAFVSGTALHQLALLDPRIDSRKSVEIVELLLRHGADITKKNSEGQTALHAIVHYSEIFENSRPVIEVYLSAQVERSIHENPRDDVTGITHLHVACMADHVSAVKFFLDKGVNIDQTINADSKLFPSCTPLRVAVDYRRLRTVKVLIERGANVHLKDTKGLSSVSAPIEKSMIIANGLQPRFLEEPENKKIIHEWLTSGHVGNNNNISSDEYGFSAFHAACTLDDTDPATNLLAHVKDIDQAVSEQSPFCPGYTALHFAAHFNLDIAKLLLERGANLLAEDVNGVTPLDVCARLYEVGDVHNILSRQPWSWDIAFSDERTKLMDLLGAMRSETSVAYVCFLGGMKDINCRIDKGSPVWPGYTPLHFAVLFDDPDKKWSSPLLIRELLHVGADCSVADVRGSSPLHLASHLAFPQDSEAARRLLASRPRADTLDNNGLSHLHVTCAVDPYDDNRLDNPARAMSPSRSDVNLATRTSCQLAGTKVRAKTTPLHLLVAKNKPVTARFMIERGADLNATDEAGWSPVHNLMLLRSPEKMAQVLFSFPTELRERVVQDVGLSHLHVACRVGSLPVVQLLLDLGSDVNAAIERSASPDAVDCPLMRNVYAGCTPLHIALWKGRFDIANVLFKAGSDILARNAAQVAPLYQVLLSDEKSAAEENKVNKLLDGFVARLRNNVDLQTRLRNMSGMTMLHILVFVMDAEGVKKLIDAGADVNAQLQANSSIWPGCTPLHIWVYGVRRLKRAKRSATVVLKALLKAGADGTVANSKLDTPLHLLVCFERMEDQTILSDASAMMWSQKDFHRNPVNANGLSHFHLAVRMNEVTAIEEFLRNGVDVDLRLDLLSDFAAGCTALHLLGYGQWVHAAESSARMMETAELLLRHGADVHARDVRGNTPLHTLANDPVHRRKLFEKFVRGGAAVFATNLAGETAFDVAFKSGLEAKEVAFYLQQGYRLNTFNIVNKTGFLAAALMSSAGSSQGVSDSIFEFLFVHVDEIKSVDDAGRTCVHNIVSTRLPRERERAFHRYDMHTTDLLRSAHKEYDLDRPKLSRLKEPVAFECFYRYWIRKLVHLGCDVSAQDNTGKTALHMAASFQNYCAVDALLWVGADMNLEDADNKTAFEYALRASRRESSDEYRNEDRCTLLMVDYLQKMMQTQLYVSQKNRNLAMEMLRMGTHGDNQKELQCFVNCLEGTKRIDIADSVSLYDLMYETSAVAAYATMPCARRSAIEKFFASEVDSLEGDMNLIGMLKLQYNKMVHRAASMQSAQSALRVLSGMPLPELVCEEVARYLSYYDIKNTIASIE